MDELEQLEQAINRDDVAEVARLRGGDPEDIRAVIAECIDIGAVMTPLTLQKVLRELDAVRARVAELEAELTKVKEHRSELAERCYRRDLELDELRERRDSRGD